ncbi:hypothetical protein NGRA_0817 [Nosema granulosis]|uniref:Uncharacterized protein n=1 Tax=Nosema granulosis TaxID=83296 RepID=A0A9P6KZQ2_9MICR|nr:hypothetical protein NGRA_0817 [Nosema granulosis]
MSYMQYLELICNLSLFYTHTLSIEHVLNLEDNRTSVSRFNLQTETLYSIESILLLLALFTQIPNPNMFTVSQCLVFIYRITSVQKLDEDNFKFKILYRKFEILMFCLLYLLFVYVTFFRIIMKNEKLEW